MANQEITDKRAEVKKFMEEHHLSEPDQNRSISEFEGFTEDGQKIYFKNRIDLAGLLLKQNQQIVRENTIFKFSLMKRPRVRKFTPQQRKIFRANRDEIESIEEKLYCAISFIEKEDIPLNRYLNSKKLNKFYVIHYKSTQLGDMFDDLNLYAKGECYPKGASMYLNHLNYNQSLSIRSVLKTKSLAKEYAETGRSLSFENNQRDINF